MSNGKVMAVTLLDMSKAFDTVNLDLLVAKLGYYGVSNTTLSWFCHYLNGRCQVASYNVKTSKSIALKTGSLKVPFWGCYYLTFILAMFSL